MNVVDVVLELLHVKAFALGFASAAQVDGVDRETFGDEPLRDPGVVAAVRVEAGDDGDDAAVGFGRGATLCRRDGARRSRCCQLLFACSPKIRRLWMLHHRYRERQRRCEARPSAIELRVHDEQSPAREVQRRRICERRIGRAANHECRWRHRC